MPGRSPAVRIRVPASTANLGPGFDSVGLALGLWDEYEVSLGDGDGLQVKVSGEGAEDVPRDATHLVVRAMAHGFARLGAPMPANICLVARNGIPHSRGLGSSASAIVAGVVAAQVFSDLGVLAEVGPESVVDVDLDVATDLSTEVATHPDVTAVVLVPREQLATHTARAVLPPHVDHRDAALNSGRAALLVEAMTRRPDLLLPATRDWLHQGFRRAAFAPSMDLVDALRSEGHAAVISGAGPSVVVLTTHERAAGVLVPTNRVGWARLEPGIPSTVEVVRT